MAERLEAIEIHTVNDLLTADPDTVAAELDHRRVDSDVVLQWQQQAELVCRVPMLRGHDAQLLVIAEVTTPEELAAADAEELFELIDPISRSSEGSRVLRGGKLPDLEEVSGWIHYAQHTRELVAA
jgi:thiamine monophosphate kinase